MPDYKQMYFKLFAAVSDAVEILNDAMLEAEELYIKSSEEDEKNVVELKLIKKNEKNSQISIDKPEL